MSTHAQSQPLPVSELARRKVAGEKFAMLTAYDVLTARVFDEAGVPALLVGDSLAMVVLGHDSTVPVTVDEMLHHLKAVRRGASSAIVIGDLPFGSYQVSVEDGMRTAIRFLKEGGATAVKLEGAEIELTRRLVRAGVPVMGHLGLTPQSVNQLGGFKVQGRDEAAAEQLVADARALEGAGAFALVLECVPEGLAAEVTAALEIPTIGIGAGPATDGQVLVAQDMLGLTSGRLPRFVKAYADLRTAMHDAVKAFTVEVADGDYPAPEHTYS